MREPKILFLLGLGILTVQIAAGQAEAEIDKNNISIHPVRRGKCPSD
jgi:hypothetical protein